MPTHSLCESGSAHAAEVVHGGYTPERLPRGIRALGTKHEVPAPLDVAIELIEMSYQEHLARIELQALFTEGKMPSL